MFKIGEKVVSKKSFIYERTEYLNGVRHPIKNEIYTIRTIENDKGYIYLRFDELRNPILGYDNGNDWDECHYLSDNFRKLDYEFADNLLAEISEAMKSETILN